MSSWAVGLVGQLLFDEDPGEHGEDLRVLRPADSGSLLGETLPLVLPISCAGYLAWIPCGL